MDAADFQVLATEHCHTEGEQVVDGRTPEDGGLAACILRNVASDGAGPGAGRIGGEDQPLPGGVVHGLLGDHPGLQPDDRGEPGGAVLAGKLPLGDAEDPVEFFRVDHHTSVSDRHRTAAQAGAAPPGHDARPELVQAFEQRGDLVLGCGADDGCGQVQAPVRGIGGVADQGEGVEKDVFPADDGVKRPGHASSAAAGLGNFAGQAGGEITALCQDFAQVPIVIAIFGQGVQVVHNGSKEAAASCRRIHQILIDEGVAAKNEHVAEKPHEQSGRAAAWPPEPKPFQAIPDVSPHQQADHLAVVGRRIIERDRAVFTVLHDL